MRKNTQREQEPRAGIEPKIVVSKLPFRWRGIQRMWSTIIKYVDSGPQILLGTFPVDSDSEGNANF